MKSKSIFLNRLLSAFFLALALALAGCATVPATSQTVAPLPGGSQFYSYGVSQSKENFENIKRAQSDYSLFKGRRNWIDITVRRSPSEFNVLQTYYPLHVRWELKDGRQFILENIDVASLMREYFNKNNITLPYQLGGRTRTEGDYDPSLVHEVSDDKVIIKWLIRNNQTPVEKRRSELPKILYEEYPVTVLNGNPTSGIDFEKRRDQPIK